MTDAPEPAPPTAAPAAPKQPSWPDEVNMSVDDSAPRASLCPYTVPAWSAALVQARVGAFKARALEDFLHRDDAEDVIRVRVAQVFGPVSETGMLTAPTAAPGTVGTAVGAAVGALGLGCSTVIIGQIAGGAADGSLGGIGQGKGAAFKRASHMDRRFP